MKNGGELSRKERLTGAPRPDSVRARVIAAFAAIYLIWGSTYLGIRIAIETMPPFLMGGARFLLAGGALYQWLRWKGEQLPTWSQWMNAAIVGTLLLGFGNGGVNWAETKVPSGTVALIIAVTPLWFALFDWLRPAGTRPRFRTLLGVTVGFGGMLFLIGVPEAGQKTGQHPAHLAAVVGAGIAWALGSLYARYTPKPACALMGIATQMLAGGVVLSLMGVVSGESEAFAISRISARSGWAFIYLTLMGSLVGFTAYSWLLKVSTPARVSTYAYVNPVIAIFLGWTFGGETLTAQMLLSAVIIIVGVIIISLPIDPARIDNG